MGIQLGSTVKDSITGFRGIATGRCEYISGCNQVLVQPEVNEKGDFVEARWLDEQRLTADNLPLVTLDNGETPGFDVPAPVR